MRKSLIVMICTALLWGCTSLSKNYKLGVQESMNKNWEQAIDFYERAVLEDPSNSYYRLALVRARISASTYHMAEARKLALDDKVDEALAEYDKALSYDPDNRLILNEAQQLIKQQRQPEEPLPVEMLYEPPVKLQVSDQPISLRFPRDVSLKTIFQALSKYAEVNIIFDDGFRDKPFSIDLTDMSFEQALDRLCMASKHFFRVVDEKTVLVLVDQPQNRMKYEQLAIKTFYLTNIDGQEVQQPLMQMVRSQTGIPQITHNKAVNSITIRTTPDRLKLAEQVIRLWDKPRGEVLVELELMEVQRQKLRDLGLELDQYGAGIAYTGGVSEEGWLNLGDVDFSNRENYSITIPSAYLRFLQTDVESKFLAQPQLRGVHGEKIEYMVGDEVPIPNSTFQAFAGGGIASTPVVNYDYKNVGIEIAITPTVHSEDEVTLELDVKIKALAGSGFADLPVITSRQVKNIIRLRDGETNLLAGLFKDTERTTLKGIPGIKEIPIIGTLFSYTDQEVQQTDVIMTITPHILRSTPIGSEDFAPLWLPLEGISGGQASGRLPRVRGMDPSEADDMLNLARPDSTQQAAGRNRITLSPPGYETGTGREARVNVSMTSEEELQNMTLNISFDPQVLKLKAIVRGTVITRLGDNPSVLENIDNASGACIVGFTAPLNQSVHGSGNIVTLVFDTMAAGQSEVTVTSVSANSTRGQPVSFTSTTSTIRVR
jgi:general secretion pathway protein D